MTKYHWFTYFFMSTLLVGCTQPHATPPSPTVYVQNQNPPQFVQVTRADTQNHQITLHVQTVTKDFAQSGQAENILDTSNPDGIINYATAIYSDQPIKQIVLEENNRQLANLLVPPADTSQAGASIESIGSIPVPPPGVKIDPNLQPLASTHATHDQKVAALRKVGESKLGTPYIWGHNEDRGQYGFDCSNYVEYVFHHALGYLFTTSSRGQYNSVGIRVPKEQMLPGDLLCFNSGSHSGIYMGNGQMIQMGGGTAKCCYLPLKPGTYWYNHISAVKRMF